jgi:hypothetical protein
VSWLEFTSQRRIEIVSPGMSAVPPFLLHLAPQVTIHDTTATDFLDQRTAIARDRFYLVERRFGAWVRKRDRASVGIALQNYMQSYQDKVVKGLIEKVKQLPMRDGNIDVVALGTTGLELGRRMAADLIGPVEDMLEAFMRDTERRETSERAYLRWLNGGQQHGHDLEDWYVAEGTLRGS